MDQGGERMALGMIAGAGTLPIEAARLLVDRGHRLSAIAFEGLTDPRLGKEVEMLRWVRLGQLETMAEAMHSMGARRQILVGKVSKELLFENPGLARPDAEAIRLLAEEKDRADEGLMAAIVRWIERRGFQFCDQAEMLAPMLAPMGPLGIHSPTATQLADLDVARPVVRELGRLGVGQCVASKEGSVLAVEAIEGTDAMIARAAEFGGSGVTIIKASRPGQDRRFDLPAVGVGTIEAMCSAGASGLAIEAGSTLIVDGPRMIEVADRERIVVWGFSIEADRAGS
jgi:DUF1009 family protein